MKLPNKTFFSNYKTTGRWHKKVGVQNKAGINLKYRSPACKQCPVKHLCTSRPAGREIDRVSMRKTLKKITNAIRKTHSYTEHDKRSGNHETNKKQ
jgi:hypothetical protein